jgi:hypothetical protein
MKRCGSRPGSSTTRILFLFRSVHGRKGAKKQNKGQAVLQLVTDTTFFTPSSLRLVACGTNKPVCLNALESHGVSEIFVSPRRLDLCRVTGVRRDECGAELLAEITLYYRGAQRTFSCVIAALTEGIDLAFPAGMFAGI